VTVSPNRAGFDERAAHESVPRGQRVAAAGSFRELELDGVVPPPVANCFREPWCAQTIAIRRKLLVRRNLERSRRGPSAERLVDFAANELVRGPKIPESASCTSSESRRRVSMIDPPSSDLRRRY